MKPTNDGAAQHWRTILVHDGARAALDAWEAFAANPDPDAFTKNALSGAADLLADAFKRRVLLRYLQFHRGNLAAVARELRMGPGSSHVARAVKELGLTEDLERIRRESLSEGGPR